MAKRWFGDHNFVNDSDDMVLLMVEPGEIVELRDGARPLDVARYSGEEYGYELEVPVGARVSVISWD